MFLSLVFVSSLLLLSSSYSFNLALWHEGVVGEAANNISLFSEYSNEMISWATNNNITQIFLLVQNPKYSIYSNSSIVAQYFLNKIQPPMKAGIVTYVRPKDSDWTINNNLPGGYNTCDLIPPNLNGEQCPQSDEPPYPQGCPNDMTQAVYYAGSINDIANEVKFVTIAFDGEDLGPYANPWGMCQVSQATQLYAKDIIDYGYAKQASLTPEAINSTVAYPEMYWVGELSYTGCTGQQTAPECTNTTYVMYKNQPQAFLDFWSPMLDKYADSVNEEGVWVLFSIENLSYGLLGSGPSCIASKYYGSNNYKQSICGTFNGFSYWDYKYFIQFLELYSQKYGVKNIGIYEAQFIPNTWM